VGDRTLFGNELTGLYEMQITGSPERNIDVHGQIAQNANTFEHLNIGTGNANTPTSWCSEGTEAAFFAENGPHGTKDWTANMGNCGSSIMNIDAIRLDVNTQGFSLEDGHCEHAQFCILAGQDTNANGYVIKTTWGSSSGNCGTGNNCHPTSGTYQNTPKSSNIAISNNYTTNNGDYMFLNTRAFTGSDNSIVDGINSAVISDSVLELYAVDNNAGGNGCTSIVTTATNGVTPLFCQNTSFNANIKVTGHVNQGATGDYAGKCSMSTSTSCTFSINTAYNSTPICIAQPQGSTAIAGACSVSSTTVTITAASSNSQTWGAILIGNAN